MATRVRREVRSEQPEACIKGLAIASAMEFARVNDGLRRHHYVWTLEMIQRVDAAASIRIEAMGLLVILLSTRPGLQAVAYLGKDLFQGFF